MTASIWKPNGFSPEIVPLAFFEGIATAAQTVINIAPYTALLDSQVEVFVAGLQLNTPAWSIAGTSIILTTPMTLGQPYRVNIYAAVPFPDNELPSQSGHAGEVLFTDGTNPYWDPVPIELPPQAGQAGKYLSTDGTTPSWQQLIVPDTFVTTITALRAVNKLVYSYVFVLGYYAPEDGGGGLYRYDATDVTSADNGGTIIVAADGGRWKLHVTDIVTTKQFGAKGDDVADDTAALTAFFNYCKNGTGTAIPGRIAAGVYRFTSIPNLAKTGLYIAGDGFRGTKLKCTSGVVNHRAVDVWAFASGSPADPYIQDVTLRDFTIEGNTNTLDILRLYGVTRSYIRVNLKDANNATGCGLRINACHINTFEVTCSADINTMAVRPHYGCIIDTGTRAGSGLGQSTNNIWLNCKFEGMPYCLELWFADQNTFVGGTAEGVSGAVTTRALLVGSGGLVARFNTFLGFAMEAAITDFSDGGYGNQYINCYALDQAILQGENALVRGGLYERLEVQPGALKNVVEELTVNYLGGGSGGFFDSGTATEWKNIKNEQTASYIYPLKLRVGIVVGASPFTWTNNTGQYVEVIIQAGTVTQVRQIRQGVDIWLKPAASPTVHLIPPLDQLEVTYAAVPAMSYVPHNGFQG